MNSVKHEVILSESVCQSLCCIIYIYFNAYVTISLSKTNDLDCLIEFFLEGETFSKLFGKSLKLELQMPT